MVWDPCVILYCIFFPQSVEVFFWNKYCFIALSIMSYFFSKVKDRENYHNLNLLEFEVVEEYVKPIHV